MFDPLIQCFTWTMVSKNGGQPVWVAFRNPVRCLDVNCQVQKSVKAKLLQKVPQTAGGIDAAMLGFSPKPLALEDRRSAGCC